MAFARRLHAGFLWCGMSWADIGRAFPNRQSPAGMAPDSISRWAREGAPIRYPPKWPIRRKLEQVMGLPVGYLDGEKPLPTGPRQAQTDGSQGGGQVVGERGIVPYRSRDAPPIPELGDVRGKSPREVRTMIEELLGIYDRHGFPIAARQVVLWLAMVEQAATSAGPAGAPAPGDPAPERPDGPPRASGRRRSGGRP